MDDASEGRKLWHQYEYAKVEVFQKRGKGDKPQDKATEYALKNGSLPIFGKHIAERNFHFLVTGWHHFFSLFSQMAPEERVYNEIIKEGEPFNFYADLELYRDFNPEMKPGSEKEAEIIEEAKKGVKAAVLRCFPHVTEEEMSLIDLDSSDQKKLSRHFVVRIAGKALKDWQTALVIYEDMASNTPADSVLWVVDEKFPDKKRFFLDRSVYTKNRQFRMYGSRKFGSYRFFHVPGFDKPGDTPDEKTFWKSLVSYFPYEEKIALSILEIKKPLKGKKITRPPGTAPDAKKRKTSTKKSSVSSGNWITDELSGIFNDEVYKVQMQEDENTCWLWVKSHDCQIAAVPHKSNHIKYLFDLNTRQFTQKCNSPSCKGMSGQTEKIPDSYWPSIDRYLKEQEEIRDYKIYIKPIPRQARFVKLF